MTVNSEFYSNLTRRKRILNARPDPIYIFISQDGHSMRFSVDILDDTVKSETQSLILENGGLVEDDSDHISPFTTILVQEGTSTDEYDRVVFNVKYILDCILQRTLQPLGPYAVGRTISDTFFDVIYFRKKVYKNLRMFDVVETDGVARYVTECDEPPSPQPSKRRKNDDSDSPDSSTRSRRKKAKVKDDKGSTKAESDKHQPQKRKFKDQDSSVSDLKGTAGNKRPSAKHRSKVTKKGSRPPSAASHSKEKTLDSSEIENSSALKSSKGTQEDSDDSIPTVKCSSDEDSSDDSFKSSITGIDSSSSELDRRPKLLTKKKSSKCKKIRQKSSNSEKTMETTSACSKEAEDSSENGNPSGFKSGKVIPKDSTATAKPEDHKEDSSGGDSFKSSISETDSSSSEQDGRRGRLKKKPKNKKMKSRKSSEKTIETITLIDSEVIKPIETVLHDSEDSPPSKQDRKNRSKKDDSEDFVVLSSDSESFDATAIIVIPDSDDESAKVDKKAEISIKRNEVIKNSKTSPPSSEPKIDGKDQKLSTKNQECEVIENERKGATNDTLEKASQKSPEGKNDDEMSQKMEKGQKCSTNKEELGNIENDRERAAPETSDKAGLDAQNGAKKLLDEKPSEEGQESGKQDPKSLEKNIDSTGKSVEKVNESDKIEDKSADTVPEKTKEGEKSAEAEPEKSKKGEDSAETAPEKNTKGEKSADTVPEKTKEGEKSAETGREKTEKGEDSAETAPEKTKKGEKSAGTETEKSNGLPKWIAPLDGVVKSRPIRSVEHCVNDPDLDIPSKSIKSSVPTRRPYTRKEQESILMYIVRKNAHLGSLRSNVIWRKMEKADVCHGRTWQSLKNHFLKTLVHELDRFPFLNSDEKELMRGPNK